jgi:hypothetical protein
MARLEEEEPEDVEFGRRQRCRFGKGHDEAE